MEEVSSHRTPARILEQLLAWLVESVEAQEAAGPLLTKQASCLAKKENDLVFHFFFS